MSLPAAPPTSASPVIRRGMVGWPVYALQDALRTTGSYVTADGTFGPATDTAVQVYQRSAHLSADGVAGPITQGRLVVDACSAVEQTMSTMPVGLMRGIALGEGGLMLAPVNWSIGGGVDCGPVQDRVVGPPFSQSKLAVAFSTTSVGNAATTFRMRRDALLTAAWVSRQANKYEAAGRIAALAHNWPWGAQQYGSNGKLPVPDAPATWVPKGLRFPDGVLVLTMEDWCEFYALGGVHGPGMITRSVTLWR